MVSDGTAAGDVSANTEDTLHTILNLRQGVSRRIFHPGRETIVVDPICKLPFIF